MPENHQFIGQIDHVSYRGQPAGSDTTAHDVLGPLMPKSKTVSLYVLGELLR